MPRLRLLLVASLVWFASVHGMHGQTPSPLIPIRAELMRSVNTRSLLPQGSFYIETTSDWQQGGCTIPAHTTIAATVVTLNRTEKGAGHLQVGLRFATVPCLEAEKPGMLPLLIAIDGPPPFPEDGLMRMATAAQEQISISQMFNPNPPPMVAHLNMLDNDVSHTTRVMNTVGWGDGDAPPSIKTGEVKGVRGVRMELPEGSPVTTLVSAHEFSLARRAQFILTFMRAPDPTTQQVASRWRVENGPTPPANAAPQRVLRPTQAQTVERTEVCAAEGCRQLTQAVANSPGGPAAWTLPLTQFGYLPPESKMLVDFDDEATVHYLGEDELLFTFATHSLMHRSAEEAARGWRPQQVRAVVLSRRNGRVLQEAEWLVRNADGPYLWNLADSRVLVHVGDSLVLYGPDLIEQARFSLPGPLIFVSAAPAANSLLVATVHEKHTAAEHARLQAFLGAGFPVPEDYDLTALDGTLHVIGRQQLGVEPLRPALLRSSMVNTLDDRGDVWSLNEQTWTGTRDKLARFASACEVEVRSLPGDLLFVQGCQLRHRDQPWFRLLNAHGATILRGTRSRTDLLQEAQSDAEGTEFAVALTEFSEPPNLAGSMRASSFQNLWVLVYDAQSGKPLLAAHPSGGSAMRQTFALSPSGASLAVLSAGALQVFAVPAPK